MWPVMLLLSDLLRRRWADENEGGQIRQGGISAPGSVERRVIRPACSLFSGAEGEVQLRDAIDALCLGSQKGSSPWGRDEGDTTECLIGWKARCRLRVLGMKMQCLPSWNKPAAGVGRDGQRRAGRTATSSSKQDADVPRTRVTAGDH